MAYFSCDQISLGIELGSTRIKCCLITENGELLATGIYEWENRFEDGYWTYSLEEAIKGVGECYLQAKHEWEKKTGLKLTTLASIGVSAMMHGLLALDKNNNLLVPFRTWRNNNAEEDSKELSDLLGFHIPARWSVAHLYYSAKRHESYLASLARITTLSSYIHQRLTGVSCIGPDDASGMFPLNEEANYDEDRITIVNALLKSLGCNLNLKDLLPSIVMAGLEAGKLSEEGAKLLDKEGDLRPGIPFVAPEGDAATGMVSTNSIEEGEGNISVGTSIFGSFVLVKKMDGWNEAIDVVNTPSGKCVAMIHCNNCTCGIDGFLNIVRGSLKALGIEAKEKDLYQRLFETALSADEDAGKLLVYNYLSGENITNVASGAMALAYSEKGRLSVANLMLSSFFGAFASFSLGMDLLREQALHIRKITLHGGLFKTPVVAQRILSSILGEKTETNSFASEGGAWGMALLASYLRYSKDMSLSEYLKAKVFAKAERHEEAPDQRIAEQFKAFRKTYERCLPLERRLGKELSTC